MAARVERARAAREGRLETCRGSSKGLTPAQAPGSCLDEASRSVLARAIAGLGLSARAHDSILRVARTIADLEGSATIGAAHVAEAVQYRCLDRQRITGVV